MINKKKILIAGGDLRQLYCARRLSEKYQVSVKGFGRDYFPPDIRLNRPEEEFCFDYAVLPVPPLDSEGMLNAPCSERKLHISEILSLLKPEGVIFAGKADCGLRDIVCANEICDYMCREELNLLNAVPSAEGAVQIALEELPVTISGLNVLITGFGRIGAALANILKGFGADVTAAVRNAQGRARAKAAGVKSCFISDIDCRYDLVFNTVPALIFDRELLSSFSRDTLFIDLASKPGGIDFEAAVELGIRAVWALGLPGKTAPVTAGEIIADTISGMIGERSSEHGEKI